MLKKNWLLPIFTLTLLVIFFLIFRSVLTYIIISAIITLMCRPVLVRIKRIRIKKFTVSQGLASVITLLIFYGSIFSFLALFVPSVAEEAKVITNIKPQKILESLQEPVAYIESIINDFSEEKISIKNYLNEKVTSIISFSAVSKWFNVITNLTGDLFLSFFAISFITFFFMKDSSSIIKGIYSIIPYTFRDEMDTILHESKTKLSRYFVGILIEVILVFTINALGLWTIGIDNFLIIALFAGVINVIPYIGPLIGIIIGSVIVLTTNHHLNFTTEILPLVGYTAVVMLITQLLDNFILQPFIYSNSVNAHPLEIFLVILIAGNLYGITGMIVAIPMYSILRVIIKEIRMNSKFLNEIY